jgi:Uma2 family endonuclease
MAAGIRNIAKLGYAEYAAIPNDGRRHEIIDGEHYVNPAPDLYHQAVSKRLQYQLYTKIELAGLGTVYNAPCDVQLFEHDIVQPDLLVVIKSRSRILTPTRVKGSPDLLVEILSPSSQQYDRKTKKKLYRRAGVCEYWIVDPSEQSVQQLILQRNRYRARIVTDKIRPEFVEGVVINLVEVW